jgi:murein DD-endopeptidase MepM/ murein hydrolase activator NlpD
MKFVLKQCDEILVFLSACILAAGLILAASTTGMAQEEHPPGPTYIVQEGDTLWVIAQRFNVTVDELARYNDIIDPAVLAVGAQLVVPGMPDVRGVLVTAVVPYGESLRSLSRRYQLPVEDLSRLNRLTSPSELFTGATIILPESSAEHATTVRVSLAPGDSLLELALKQELNPWMLVGFNGLPGTWAVLPGETLRFPDADGLDGPGALPASISSIEINALPFVQGGTVVVQVQSPSTLTLHGLLNGREFSFFSAEDGTYVALQGIHAMARPGFYPLTLQGSLGDGTPIAFSQNVYVRDGNFNYETLVVPPQTLDPANTKPEDELWYELAIPVTPEKLWSGEFISPVSPLFATCWPSLFGARRSYNGSPFNYFHTGLDFCGGVGAEIFAPAEGVVVFTDDLTVRGKSTMIDHGWGVYTTYMHQSEILVDVGERVEQGQVIGLVGATGRVTGSHLHWEVFVGGVQVDPMDWLEKEFP